MNIQVTCPKCHRIATLARPETRRVQCPHCQALFEAPETAKIPDSASDQDAVIVEEVEGLASPSKPSPDPFSDVSISSSSPQSSVRGASGGSDAAPFGDVDFGSIDVPDAQPFTSPTNAFPGNPIPSNRNPDSVASAPHATGAAAPQSRRGADDPATASPWLLASLAAGTVSLVAGLITLVVLLVNPPKAIANAPAVAPDQIGGDTQNNIVPGYNDPTPSSPANPSPEHVHWKFKVGDTFEVFKREGSETRRELLTTDFIMSIWERWKVASVEADGTANMKSTLVRMVVETKAPDEVIVFDSDQEDVTDKHERIAKMVRPALGKPISFQMSPIGTVSNAVGPPGLRGFTMPGGLTIETQAEKFLPHSTDKPFSNDLRWSTETQQDARGIRFTKTQEYAFANEKQYQGKLLHAFECDQKIKIDELPPGLSLSIVVDSADGECVYDLQEGHLVSYRMHTKITQTVERAEPVVVQSLTDTLVKIERMR